MTVLIAPQPRAAEAEAARFRAIFVRVLSGVAASIRWLAAPCAESSVASLAAPSRTSIYGFWCLRS